MSALYMPLVAGKKYRNRIGEVGVLEAGSGSVASYPFRHWVKPWRNILSNGRHAHGRASYDIVEGPIEDDNQVETGIEDGAKKTETEPVPTPKKGMGSAAHEAVWWKPANADAAMNAVRFFCKGENGHV